MRPGFQIRAGRLADADRLAVLATQVWLHTYATEGINSEIAEYVRSELAAEKFAQALKDPQACFLVAGDGEALFGFARLAFGAPCPAGHPTAAELKTLYVQAPFIGGGIGKALLRAAEDKARAHSGSPVWLTVNARNARAIAFYARQGYTQVGTTYFILGQGRHENHVLVGGDR